jgi:hypothetical protein
LNCASIRFSLEAVAGDVVGAEHVANPVGAGVGGADALPASAASYSSRMRFFLASKLGSLERFQVLTA